MESANTTNIPTDDGLTLRDLVMAARNWARYLYSRKWVLLIYVTVGAVLGIAYSLISKPKYTAELTFVLEESKSSQLGSYAGIASQLGFDLSGNAGSGVFAGDNILGFLGSRLMVEQALLTPVPPSVTGKKKDISLLDYYLNVMGWKEKWKTDTSLTNLAFPPGAASDKFTRKQDSVLQSVYNVLIKKHLTLKKPDKKLSFILVKCETKDEMFSKLFTERLVKAATVFYIQTKTQRSQTNISRLQAKADSLEFLLNRSTYSTAATQDLNFNPARNQSNVRTELAAREKGMLQILYAEVVKNLELSRISMLQEAPLIQIVDPPNLPLKKAHMGLLAAMIVGGFLMGVIGVLAISTIRAYKQILSA